MFNRRASLIFCLFTLLGTLVYVVPTARLTTFPNIGKTTLRVMTYNIHVGVGMDKKLDLQRIAQVINDQHPDLVGLQEVDRGVKRTEGSDEIAELAKLTSMNYAFAHNLDY
jgi:endonuclease/exonuclease/phosphatase family metal-dependent hydrolase